MWPAPNALSSIFSPWRRVPVLGLWFLASACSSTELREDDVGDAAACEGTARWPTSDAEREDELAERVARLRSRGGECGGTRVDPAPAVEVSPNLRCAARLQAEHIAASGDVGHVGRGGTSAVERIGASGYEGIPTHELVAGNFIDPVDVLRAWLDNEDLCRALHDQDIIDIGIGHAISSSGDASGWVLVTGSPRP